MHFVILSKLCCDIEPSILYSTAAENLNFFHKIKAFLHRDYPEAHCMCKNGQFRVSFDAPESTCDL